MGLLFAFMPVLASNNNSTGNVDQTEILLVLLRYIVFLFQLVTIDVPCRNA